MSKWRTTSFWRPALNFVDTFLDSPKAGKMIVWIKYPFYFFTSKCLFSICCCRIYVCKIWCKKSQIYIYLTMLQDIFLYDVKKTRAKSLVFSYIIAKKTKKRSPRKFWLEKLICVFFHSFYSWKKPANFYRFYTNCTSFSSKDGLFVLVNSSFYVTFRYK